VDPTEPEAENGSPNLEPFVIDCGSITAPPPDPAEP